MSVALRCPPRPSGTWRETQGVCIRPVVHEVYDTVTGKTQPRPDAVRGHPGLASARPAPHKNRVAADAAVPRGLAPRGGARAARTPARTRTTRPTIRTTRRSPSLPAPAPFDQATPGRARPPSPPGRAANGRHGVHHARRQDLPAVSMFVTFTLPSYGPVRTRRDAPVDRRRTTTVAPPSTRCTSRSSSTGSGRTCGERRATRCSTSPRVEAQHRLAPHLHAAVRGAIPRELLRRRWPRRRTTRSGGRRTTSRSTPDESSRSGVDGRRVRRPDDRAPAARPGTRPSTRSTTTRRREPAHVIRFGQAARHPGDHRDRG